MSEQTQHFYTFGEYKIEKTERLLTRRGEVVPLPPKAVELLFVLLESNNHILTKDELMNLVWADSFVEEANLSRNVFLLRKVLGEGKNGEKFIETIPKRGYRFAANVTETNGDEAIEIIAHERTLAHIVIEEEIETSDAPEKIVETETRQLTPEQTLKARNSWFQQYRAIVLPTVLLAIVGAAVSGWFAFFSESKSAALKPAKTFTLVTNSGKASNASISPDGKFIAYGENYERGEGVIYVRQIDTNREVKLLEPGERTFGGTAFSPDGAFIYYVVYDKQDPHGALYRIPVLGGVATRVLPNFGSMFTFSPDGLRVAFYRKNYERKEESIMIAALDGSGEQAILTRPFSEAVLSAIAAWSPDGKTIAFGAGVERTPDKIHLDVKLYSVEIESGAVKQLSNEVWSAIGKMNWLADGGGLVFVASRPRIGNQLYFFDYHTGETRRVTEGLQSYGNYSLGVTADGSVLAAGTWEEKSHLWTIGADGDTSRAVQLSKGETDGNFGLTNLADGRVAYIARVGSDYDVWTMNPDGSDAKPLTADSFWESGLTATADGRFLIFISNRAGGNHLFRMNADGSDVRQLTFGEAADHAPDSSPDGQWIVYQSWFADKFTLRKIPTGGGESVQLTDYQSVMPSISPDGNSIACILPSDSRAHPATLAVISAAGGEPQKTFAVIPFGYFYQSPRWTPDGQALIYAKQEKQIGNLWKQPLAGGEPAQLTNFNADIIANYAYSCDGSRLLVSRGQLHTNIVLIKNFK
ncbi:MAG: PD40 domain-containing protein [Acidobacteria bacterium]|nr:PD40 domain-containing protein [Acidobacteriota bacterium]